MATIVNNPPSTGESGGGLGFVLGIILLIAFIFVLLIYGMPYLGNMIGGTQVNVPGKIDVNVKPGK